MREKICRKIQGVYWNDLREPSLTSEYCDYMQFYRKNSELSAEAKDKIKTDLARCRNSQKEVFVKDYDNWMKYESQGSFRLNKVSRSILMKYCPFAKEVRSALMANPQYQKGFMKFEVDNERKRMGANIQADGHVAVIEGVDHLQGAPVQACDLRAGAAMVIAGLCAQGVTELSQVQFIERGYEDLVDKLRAVGADIRVVDAPDITEQKEAHIG